MPDAKPQTKPSLDQKRALHALARIESRQTEKDAPASYGKYVSYVKGLPATIIQSGFGQALAMLNAGSKPGHRALFADVADWLCDGWTSGPVRQSLPPMPTDPQERAKRIFQTIMTDEKTYLQVQAETMAYLEWLKKFAVAFLRDEGGAE
ncbi:type III-B CRISPR module-associated protein Cmr5 [Rhizobium sp. SG2393]|uniref:type III-B CRISPR module-associated protein Cmr5 n=1 Tax=Rhizobium sp. SG2393 TaxID=3276279 RepID=UPI0036709DDD